MRHKQRKSSLPDPSYLFSYAEYPRIVVTHGDGDNAYCVAAVRRILRYLLPPTFFQEEGSGARLFSQLPLVCWTPLADPPFDLSFFLCCRFRPNAFRFFYELVSQWLIPGKRLNALLQFATDFVLPDLGTQTCIGGEVKVRVESARQLEALRRNLPIVSSEIRLGVESHYQACRILEVKGLTSDEKTAWIQESIISLIRRRPQDFDYDILSEMQHFLVLCREEFKVERSHRHMSRIICVHYLFRRALKLSLESFPNRRYISVKLVRAKLRATRPILGIILGLSYIEDNELFEARHILSGVQAIVPGARHVSGSFFQNHGCSDSICTLYLEIEKEGGITPEEQARLKEELPSELKNRFEKRCNLVFMPHNEEMVMRNILTLSSQLRFVRDLPQVMIEFNQQLEEHLEFLVIVARVAKPHMPTLYECLKNRPSFLELVPDRVKQVGTVRKKYTKEVYVFRLRMRKHPFFRPNHSVDLYKARQEIACELARLIGEFRDYNGGMISQETELLDSLKGRLGFLAEEHAFLLENYFYSFTPPIMRSLLPLEPFERLFSMILEEELGDEQRYAIRIHEDVHYLYALITSVDAHFHEGLDLRPYEGRVASCLVPQGDCFSFGVIVRDPTTEDSLAIRLAIEELMTA